MQKTTTRLILLSILLLACGLRLHAIERQDIWGDEAFSIWLSQQPLPAVIAGGADTHPPGYPLLLALWMRALGSSPLAVRALSALTGLLIVPAAYVLGRRALRPPAGLLAALLTTASPALVYYAQETRMYSQLTLCAALSFYWTLRWLDAPTRKNQLLYLLFTLAAAYTHYYAFFLILAENMVVCWQQWPRQKRHTLIRWLGMETTLVLAYLPWLAVQYNFLSGKVSARVTAWSLSTAWEIARETFTLFSAGLALDPQSARAITIAFLPLLLVGIGAALRKNARHRPLIAYLLLPFICAWAVNPLMPFYFPRYLLLIAPAFYLLLAAGIMALRRRWEPFLYLGTALLLLGSGWGLHGYYTDAHYVKGRYGEMLHYVKEHARPDDLLLLANPLQIRIFEYYQPTQLDHAFTNTGTLPELTAGRERVWLVRYGNRAEYDPADQLNGWLSTHGSKAHASGWKDADLALYILGTAASTPQHPLNIDLGAAIHLRGYSLSAERLSPGDTLLLTLYWETGAALDQRYTVFTHLLDAGGVLQAQLDNEPQGGSLPTDSWATGELIRDNYALTLPPDAPPGAYTLRVGMYHWQTGARLPVPTAADDQLTLQTVAVQ
ncbi:MAG: glycosyltransferase family 39 protein [Chloroflexota bacterium]|nr:glycosyltransferase family 39 protein [Chloroflexota bacterium]